MILIPLLRAVEGPSGVGGAGRSGRAMPGDAAGDLVALWRAVSEVESFTERP